MGIPATLSSVPAATPYIQYIATNGQTVFPYPFVITQDSDLVVVINGLTQPTDSGYSLSGVGNSTGGNVTFGAGQTAGAIITLFRNIAIQRITQIGQNSGYSSTAFNAEYNNIYLILQQLQESIALSLQVPNTNSPAPTTTLLPANYANKYLAFDANGNPTPAVLTSSGALTQAIIAGLLSTQTPAEVTAGVAPANFAYIEGDIRRYGATTVAGNNSVAINAALSVSAAGGNAAFIPGGTWAYTATITASGSSSMYGVGEASILAPNACDGLSFGIQGAYAGSRFMRDFFINGTGTGANNGIIVNFTAASGNKVTGMVFSNVTVEGFGQGVFLRGLWTSVFRDCFLYNNYEGYRLHGQNVQVSILGGIVQKGALAGAGTQYACLIDSVSGETSQSIYLGDNLNLYGYDTGVLVGPAFDISIIGCSFNFLNQYGVSAAAVTGGFNVIGNFFQTNNAAFATGAIVLSDLGSPVNDRQVIDANHCECNAANAGSIGIYVGANNLAVTVSNNTAGQATTAWNTGISVVGKNTAVKFNSVYATTTAVLINSAATGVEVGPNLIQNGTALAFSSLTPANFSYFAEGTFAVTLTGMASGGTGTGIWRASGGLVTVKIPSAGITGTSNATTMTMTGLPQWLWPNTDGATTAQIIDSSATALGLARVAAASGVFTFFKDTTGTVFTNTGSKGLNGSTITYSYD